MGGIGIPTIVLLGLGLIPYLDREDGRNGRVVRRARRLAAPPAGSSSSASAPLLRIEAFAIRFGWLREWFPDVPQLVITSVNPGNAADCDLRRSTPSGW